jgi:hypothetical protein
MRLESPELWLMVALIMVVPMIYSFRFHRRLLLDGQGARATRGLFFALAAVGLALGARYHFDRGSRAIAAALVSPAVHRLIFRSAFRRFVERVGREPEDMAFSSEPQRLPDRAFAIMFGLGCTLGSMVAIGISYSL